MTLAGPSWHQTELRNKLKPKVASHHIRVSSQHPISFTTTPTRVRHSHASQRERLPLHPSAPSQPPRVLFSLPESPPRVSTNDTLYSHIPRGCGTRVHPTDPGGEFRCALLTDWQPQHSSLILPRIPMRFPCLIPAPARSPTSSGALRPPLLARSCRARLSQHHAPILLPNYP